MNVLIVTVCGSLALATLFVLLFLFAGRTTSVDQDSLLPLDEEKERKPSISDDSSAFSRK
ncbi:MAG: hypothetical protein AAF514_00400 [Verrucomicrobiota bacterium]